MSNWDKYILLTALSFFFASLAVSLISLKGPSSSYMYTPRLDSQQTSPVDEASRQYQPQLPESVLHYPKDIERREDTVTCYLADQYETLITNRTNKNGAVLVASARMDEDKLEIYSTESNGFFVFVVGPDATGQIEACEVATGTDWALIKP